MISSITPNPNIPVKDGLPTPIERAMMEPPLPDPLTLTLQMNERIQLTAQKFDLRLDFLYHSGQIQTEYGNHRAALVRQFIQSSTSAKRVTVVRGDCSKYVFSIVTSGAYVARTAGILTTLQFASGKFTEFYNDGHQLTYEAQNGTGNPVTHQLMTNVEPAGTRQSYVYSTGAEAGLLKTIQVHDGSKVSFIYQQGVTTSLLNVVQDWGGRRWTYQYDAGENCTTLTMPSGCIIKYGIDNWDRVKTRENPQGFVSTYGYFAFNNPTLLKAVVADGTWLYNYDADGNGWTTEQVPSGALTTYNGTGLPGWIEKPGGRVTTLTYNSNTLETSEINPTGSKCTTVY
ncbi:MAG: hypothetical protein QOJ65_2602, partial [Fimbriimonadaceae bacterium]|nr:hypothetical protein [Fimbriimonadaceae bacterium]